MRILLSCILLLAAQDAPREKKKEHFMGWGKIEQSPPMGQPHPAYWFVPDGKGSPMFLADDDDVKAGIGDRVWILGTVRDDRLYVGEHERLPKALKEIPTGERKKSIVVELSQVRAWCDHMPNQIPGQLNQHLDLRVILRNRTDKDLKVSIGRVFVSFDRKKEGAVLEGMSFVDWKKPKDLVTSVTLPPKKALSGMKNISPELKARRAAYKEDMHGKKIFVLLVFEAGGERIFVRNDGAIKSNP
ncbi:MAG: hypothetical protein ACYTAF_08965 [Planctomycetota bacterium]|jgi:hypothetical protein